MRKRIQLSNQGQHSYQQSSNQISERKNMGIFDKFKSKNEAGFFSFSLTQDQIQKKFESKLPLTYEKFFCSLTLSDPNVTILEEGNRVAVKIKATAKIPFVGEKNGTAVLSGIIIFSKEKKSVFLGDPKIDLFSIEGLPSDKAETFKQLAQLAVEQTLKQTPIYQLPDGATARVIKSIEVKEGKLNVSLGL